MAHDARESGPRHLCTRPADPPTDHRDDDHHL